MFCVFCAFLILTQRGKYKISKASRTAGFRAAFSFAFSFQKLVSRLVEPHEKAVNLGRTGAGCEVWSIELAGALSSSLCLAGHEGPGQVAIQNRDL